jgi:gluconolactonase
MRSVNTYEVYSFQKQTRDNIAAAMRSTALLVLAILPMMPSAAPNSSCVRIPSEWLYLLPQPFDSNLGYSWLNSTTSGNSTVSHLLVEANQARFISYSDEFDNIVGSNPTWSTISCPSSAGPACAFEGGAWIPDSDEVWFSYSGFDYPYNYTITSFDLRNGSSTVVTTDPAIQYPYGMYYWPYDGKVYVTEINIPTDPATVITIDPKTMEVTPIFNSYQGIPLGVCDDTVVARVNNKDYVFATTLPIHANIPKVPQQRYDTAVWRFSLEDKTLLPVISSNEIIAPNGIRASPDGRKLYVTNTAFIPQDELEEQANKTALSNAIYVYDLDDYGFPHNGRLFGLVRTGIANGASAPSSTRFQSNIFSCRPAHRQLRSSLDSRKRRSAGPFTTRRGPGNLQLLPFSPCGAGPAYCELCPCGEQTGHRAEQLCVDLQPWGNLDDAWEFVDELESTLAGREG